MENFPSASNCFSGHQKGSLKQLVLAVNKASWCKVM